MSTRVLTQSLPLGAKKFMHTYIGYTSSDSFTMLTLAVFLGAVVALISGCCTPDQWEGGEGVVIGYSGPGQRGGLIREYIEVSYDYTNKRSAGYLFYENGRIERKMKIVVRYGDDLEENCSGKCNEGRMYAVDLKTGKCWKKSIKAPFRKACIPEKAKFMGDYYLGLKGGLKASSYEFDGKDFMASIFVSKLDNEQCIPIGENIAAHKGRYSTLSNVGFVNITPGIKNATVFDVPKQCEEEDFPPSGYLTRENHFFAL